MKHLIILLTSLGLITSGLAQEEAVADKEFGSYEVTLGGAGVALGDESWFGFDFSVSSNPFEVVPDLWLGIAQGFAWEPSFAGSTDLFADWSWHLFGDLYLNTGWSAGVVYGHDFDLAWRTGPEAVFQYYVTDGAFIYAGANYDIFLKREYENGIRYSFGIGVAF